MQFYHRLVKRNPWRSRKQERNLNAKFNNDNEVLSTITSRKMIGILQPPDYVINYILCGYQCDKAVNKNDTREVI